MPTRPTKSPPIKRDWKRYEAVVVGRRAGKTQWGIARELGITGERVKQMEEAAFRAIHNRHPEMIHLAPITDQDAARHLHVRRLLGAIKT